MTKSRAFTLAEVLITLGIIGIVAAMTMPALIAKYQKQETVAKLKKSYTTLYQAFNMSQAENGSAENWTFESMDKQGWLKFLDTYLFPYVKTAKVCRTDNAQCFADNAKYLNGDSYNSTHPNYNTFIMSDGSAVSILFYQTYAAIYIDINGKKSPNILGKDIFRYGMAFDGKSQVTAVGIGQAGRALTRDEIKNGDPWNPTYGCNKTGLGEYCSGLIMYDGWEIKDDYPW